MVKFFIKVQLHLVVVLDQVGHQVQRGHQVQQDLLVHQVFQQLVPTIMVRSVVHKHKLFRLLTHQL
jgi:hypothetical protein